MTTDRRLAAASARYALSMRTRSAVLAMLTMIAAQTAPALAQQAPPSRAALVRAVRRLVSREVGVESCRALGVSGGEHQYSCSVHTCTGGCESTFIVTVLGFRGDLARIVSRTRRRGGDTGRCGCCIDAF